MREYTDKIDVKCQMCNTWLHDLWEQVNDHVEKCHIIHPHDAANYNLAKSHIGIANYLKALEKLRWENRIRDAKY